MFDQPKTYEQLEEENKRLTNHRICKLIESATTIVTNFTLDEQDETLKGKASKFLSAQFDEYTELRTTPLDVTFEGIEEDLSIPPEELQRLRKQFEESTGLTIESIIVGNNIKLTGEDLKATFTAEEKEKNFPSPIY